MVDGTAETENWFATRLNAAPAAPQPGNSRGYQWRPNYSGDPLAVSLAAGKGLRKRSNTSSV